MTLEDCRRFYAEEIELAANIRSRVLAEALARVPREKFLGPGPWQIASAEQRVLATTGMVQLAYRTTEEVRHLYHNVVIVIDAARDVNNGQPSALARWIDALDLKAGHRVYHMGCGVGYYTAIMAELVGPGGIVVASEVLPDLAARARTNLSDYSNIEVHAGDGGQFDPGPCDAMLINAGVTHPHPLWVERLREGGRLVVPLTIAATPTVGQGVMLRITRERGGFSADIVTFLAICSCSSLRDPDREGILRTALTTGALLKVRSARLDPHDQTDSCLMHGPGVCLSNAELVVSR